MQDASYYNRVYSGEYYVDVNRVKAVASKCHGHILDLGCGDGALGVEYDGPYTGLDFSDVAIRICARDSKKQHRYFVQECLDGPYPAGKYGTVVLGEVLEHITESAQEVLFNKITSAAGKARIVVTVPREDRIDDPSHIRTFSEDSIEQDFKRYGFVQFFELPPRYIGFTIDPNPHPHISVALIVKDEAAVLQRCVDSVKPFCDELVIVDTGSTDDTIKIAKSTGARIGHFDWCDDFAAARNYAESLCTGEWIFWIDADEVLIEGCELVRTFIADPQLQAIRPWIIFDRDEHGNPIQSYCRQELIHRNNGRWRWAGAAHNYLEGPNPIIETQQIVYDHLGRPDGDRPNFKDIFVALRKNLGRGLEQRHLFYLARQHWYENHYQECIGLCKLLLEQKPGWPLERSDTAILMGDCYRLLGRRHEAAVSYLRAIEEYGQWAEPYFKLGALYYEGHNYTQGAAYFGACLAFSEPPEMYADQSIYQWRAHDMYAVCLSKIGRWEEAAGHGRIALTQQPDNQRLLDNQAWYERHLSKEGV